MIMFIYLSAAAVLFIPFHIHFQSQVHPRTQQAQQAANKANSISSKDNGTQAHGRVPRLALGEPCGAFFEQSSDMVHEGLQKQLKQNS